MIKNITSFFVILLGFPFLFYAMDQQNNSIKTIISAQNVHSIEFIGPKEVIVNKPNQNSEIISIESGQGRPFAENFTFSDSYSMAVDKAKKRIVFVRPSGLNWSMHIYQPALQDWVFTHTISWAMMGYKRWRPSLDERKPTAILLNKNNHIISCDYWSSSEYRDDCLSEGFQDKELHDARCGFNKHVGNYIIGQCDQGFKIFFDSPHSECRQKLLCNISDHAQCERNYLCSSDMSFIVHYTAPVGHGHCYIYNIKTKKNIQLRDQDNIIRPCSMQIHPNDEVIVTMAAGDRCIQYWQASTGMLLSEQKMSNLENLVNEIGTFNKYLSFSADGKLLAAVYPDEIVVSQVPIEVLCAMPRKSLIWTLWFLRNMALPKDVAYVIFDALKV